jgi:integrase
LASTIKPYNNHLPLNNQKTNISYLSPDQLDRLTDAFLDYYEENERYRKARGRLWIVYLFLRYTGARLNEILRINESTDIDFRNNEIKIVTLKQRKQSFRIVPCKKSTKIDPPGPLKLSHPSSGFLI